MLHVLNVKDVEDTYSSSVYLIQKEEKDDNDNDWVQHVLDPQHRQKQKKPFLVVSMSKTSEDTVINFGVHSTMYRIYVEDVEDIQMYMYLFQEDDPDKNKTWFELGADIGLEIVEDEEVEAEVDQNDADEEVARMYEDAKKRHRKIMTGGFK